MNKKIYNILMYLYFNGLIKTFMFCSDCQDHFMFYIDDLEDIKEFSPRLMTLLGDGTKQIKHDEAITWKNGDTEVVVGTQPTEGNEDEKHGKLRVEIDLVNGDIFDPLLKNLYQLEKAISSD